MLVILAAIRLLVLPVDGPDPATSGKLNTALEQVLAEMRGVELVRLDTIEPGLAKTVAKLKKRCGNQRDCQLKLGQLLKLNVLVLTRTEPLDEGVNVAFDFIDLGTRKSKRKLTRTLGGADAHRRDVLEHVVTDTLFPERVVGRIEIRISPPGAEVYLDDKLKITDAPATVSLENIPAGRHTLRIAKSGYKDLIAIVHVPFKGVSVLDAKLRPDTPK